MKAKTNVNFHNRFDIEVRDAKTGVLKQKGIAENIVLDQMYDRLCNFQTYFNYIHFGTGVGTPEPGVSLLFNHLGYKTPETEEVIKSLPTSKWTRKITLNPEEFVDETITEVGIGYGSSPTDLVTHAIIKDSEGNSLSLTKTALDVVVIYASVFTTLIGPSYIKWNEAFNNPLIGFFTGEPLAVSQMRFDTIPGQYDQEPIGNPDLVNRKIELSTRVPIDKGNTERNIVTHFAIGVWSTVNSNQICEVDLSSLMGSQQLMNEEISGVTDGVNKMFSTKFMPIIPESVIIKNSEGVQINSNEYQIDNLYNNKINPFIFLDKPSEITDGFGSGLLKNKHLPYSRINTWATHGVDVLPEFRNIGISELTVEYGQWTGFKINFISLSDEVTPMVSKSYSSSIQNATYTNFASYDYSQLKRIEFSTYMFNAYQRNGGATVVDVKPLLASEHMINFNNPPNVGTTISYEVPGLPKDENYVVDIVFTLQFGEGV